MDRPIHRTKTFWLGIFLLIFLSWAFLRSIGHSDSIGYTTPASRSYIEAGSRAGSLTLQSGKWPIYATFSPRWYFKTEKRHHRSISFREPFEVTTIDGTLWIEFDYWFLALLFTATWTAILRWRHRTTTTPLTAPAPHDTDSSPPP